MSTRCNVVLRNGNSTLYLYRHCDGYPAETGADVFEKVRASKDIDALILAFLSERYDATEYQPARPVYDVTTDLHGDIEYVYQVTFDDDGPRLGYARRGSAYPPLEAWSRPVPLTFQAFADMVNFDRAEMNRRLAQLRDECPASYGESEDYPMLENNGAEKEPTEVTR